AAMSHVAFVFPELPRPAATAARLTAATLALPMPSAVPPSAPATTPFAATPAQASAPVAAAAPPRAAVIRPPAALLALPAEPVLPAATSSAAGQPATRIAAPATRKS